MLALERKPGSIIAVLIAVLGADHAPKAQTTDVEICNAIESALTSTGNLHVEVHPISVQPSSRTINISNWTADAVREAGISSAEYSDLKLVEARQEKRPFLPRCDWGGLPMKFSYGDIPAHLEFTRPLLSSDRQLAVIEYSTIAGPRLGAGTSCVMRKRNGEWSGRCTPSWIS